MNNSEYYIILTLISISTLKTAFRKQKEKHCGTCKTCIAPVLQIFHVAGIDTSAKLVDEVANKKELPLLTETLTKT